MMTGEEKPDAGTVEVSDNVVMGYVNQSRDALEPCPKRLGRNFRQERHPLSRQARNGFAAPMSAPSASAVRTSKKSRRAVGRGT
jgi:ATPase subunit of ABC transporter with duplicated ATPase domains